MKHRLLTPGPSPVPEETLLELARPVFYHRSTEFRQLHAEVVKDLQQVFLTQNAILTLTSSGTGSMEAAVVNTVPRGKKAICLSAGRFGDRWKQIGKAFGIETINVTVPPGQSVQPDMLERALAAHPDAVAVCSTLSETATGAGHDIAAFGRIVAQTPALLVVDAISGLGAMECRVDAWNIDICCAGSQKALMMPPGLAFVSVSDKAWQVIDAYEEPPTFYFDLKKARHALRTNDTPFTPAHTLIRGLRVSLKKIVAEGMENLFVRQARYAAAARAGFEAMGLEIFPSQPNTALTVVKSPPSIDGSALLDRLESRFGIKLANGQDALKGKIFRLAHLGYIDQFDILAALSGVEIVLAEMGFGLTSGAGVAAAQRVFAGSP